jgi:leucyl/phenylalanyl-tRNA--protein transferase
MFFGESMFAWATDASKIALCGLVCLCREHGVPLIDCQQNTRHLSSFGGREISREDFQAHLQQALPAADIADWTYDPSLWRHLLDEQDDAPAREDPS